MVCNCAEKDQLEELSCQKGIHIIEILVYKIRKCLKYIYTKNVLEIHAVYIKRSIKQKYQHVYFIINTVPFYSFFWVIK